MRARYAGAMLALMAAMVAGGCSDATGPDSDPSASGAWEGPFHHPSYDGGSISLTLIDANGAVSGTYRLRLTRVGDNGRAQVTQRSGNVTGSASASFLTLRLDLGDGSSWLMAGSRRGNHAAGEWTSDFRISGDFEINR